MIIFFINHFAWTGRVHFRWSCVCSGFPHRLAAALRSPFDSALSFASFESRTFQAGQACRHQLEVHHRPLSVHRSSSELGLLSSPEASFPLRTAASWAVIRLAFCPGRLPQSLIQKWKINQIYTLNLKNAQCTILNLIFMRFPNFHFVRQCH